MVYYEYLFLYFLPQKLVKVLLGMQFAGTRSVLIPYCRANAAIR